MTTSNDIEELYRKIEENNYDITSITSREALQLLGQQISDLFKLTECGDELDLSKLVPSEKRQPANDEDAEIGITLRQNNKLQYNFSSREEELLALSARKQALVKKFYLKQSPSLSTTEYLERIFKHCTLSTSVILTCSVYLFNLVLGLYYESQVLQYENLQLLPLNQLNFYRLVLVAIRLSLKFIEDKNFKIRYYCKIVGLNVKEYSKLELNFAFLIDFRFFVNEVILVDNLKTMKRLHAFARGLNA